MLNFAMFLCHILSSGLNCKFVRREHGFSINLKISLISSGDKPILSLKISIINFCRFRYFADFDIEIVLLGKNKFYKARETYCKEQY